MPTQLRHLTGPILIAILLLAASPARAAIWSNTEMHLQYGELDTPYLGFIEPGLEESKDTLIITLQHASGWKYGDNFFFFDVLLADEEGIDGFNNNDIYGEWYPYFSFRKMGGKEMGKGALQDVRFIAGLNYASQAKVLKYLPGIGLSWNAKGFAFLNTDITAYIDDSAGAADGGVPAEDDSFMVDVNWKRPFGKKWSIEGHIEYIGSRTNEFGGDVSWWVLGQPQFRYYVKENLAIGIEWQFWINKLGDPDTDENTAQALLVWAF
jgi:nucleoside-specific outer membrane channel protein Tsx